MKPSNLTTYAQAGFEGNQNPHLFSSPCWFAHSIGAHLQATGRSAPRDVRMGRGDSVRANDMRFKITFSRTEQRVLFERVE